MQPALSFRGLPRAIEAGHGLEAHAQAAVHGGERRRVSGRRHRTSAPLADPRGGCGRPGASNGAGAEAGRSTQEGATAGAAGWAVLGWVKAACQTPPIAPMDGWGRPLSAVEKAGEVSAAEAVGEQAPDCVAERAAAVGAADAVAGGRAVSATSTTTSRMDGSADGGGMAWLVLLNGNCCKGTTRETAEVSIS